MASVDRVLPAALVVAGFGALFVPGVDGGAKTFLFAVCAVCATGLVVMQRRPDSGEAHTEFKVSVKEIAFVHTERPKTDRPPASDPVMQTFDRAKVLAAEGRFADAAALYSKAFQEGGEYWAAKVNEAYCYQVQGNLERALKTYSIVEAACPVPRFRRQALGNSGEIYRAMAFASDDENGRRSLGLRAYEKYVAAVAAEETFVSLYNLWQASHALGKSAEGDLLLQKLRQSPEFEALPPEQRIPEQLLVGIKEVT